MSEFKKYKRKGLSEMRPFVSGEIINTYEVSISPEDIANGSPKEGDMIARNPLNYSDKWLVSKKYFEENLEEVKEDSETNGEPTFGELAVGLSFNPSALSKVDEVKRAFAGLIDTCHNISTFTYLGHTLKGMAIRVCIEAQMAVVKLITFKEK